MIDRKVVWKVSLNILSHHNSREFMEREENKLKTDVLFKFLKYDQVSDIKNICYTKVEIYERSSSPKVRASY